VDQLLPGDGSGCPVRGYKMSGYGRESGLQQMEEYLNVKAVWIKTA
jgi:aldehyde dehydrogenase (NAD+)